MTIDASSGAVANENNISHHNNDIIIFIGSHAISADEVCHDPYLLTCKLYRISSLDSTWF